MSRTLLLAPALLGLVLVLGGAAHTPGERPGPRWDGDRHVVHEWGTFTEAQGSDGRVLLGLTHDPFDLPPFVYDLGERLGITGRAPKMETPVLYFYSPTEWRLRVRADFPRGWMTQWYPAASRANAMAHDGVYGRPGSPIPAELSKGYLEWGRKGELVVLPPGETSEPPEVREDDPWRFSREVGANHLVVTNRAGELVANAPRREEAERFLFYRGLGDFPLPLSAKVAWDRLSDDGYAFSLDLTNRTPQEPVGFGVLLHVRGERAGYALLGTVEDRAHYPALELPFLPRSRVLETVAEVLENSLCANGLYADEARAMVRTWRAAWLERDGLRLLYVLPRPFVERELPLTVEPVQAPESPESPWAVCVRVAEPAAGPLPDELVRVFVGRLDLLTPTLENDLRATVEGTLSFLQAERERAEATVRAWGRWAPPYLQRARALGASEAALGRALALHAGAR